MEGLCIYFLFSVFEILKFELLKYEIQHIEIWLVENVNIFKICFFEKLKSRKRAPEMMKSPVKFWEILDMNVISLKKHEMEIW